MWTELKNVETLIDKIAFLLSPQNFAKIFPYCFWYWLVLTLIVIYVMRKK